MFASEREERGKAPSKTEGASLRQGAPYAVLVGSGEWEVMRTDARLADAETEAENSAMSTVRKEIQSLSVADRLQLLEEIWDSLIETPEAVPVTDAQRKELERRRRAHARNPSAAKSWAQVRARLRRRK
jgi:putative addiction module component (TIGR02574 family)